MKAKFTELVVIGDFEFEDGVNTYPLNTVSLGDGEALMPRSISLVPTFSTSKEADSTNWLVSVGLYGSYVLDSNFIDPISSQVPAMWMDTSTDSPAEGNFLGSRFYDFVNKRGNGCGIGAYPAYGLVLLSNIVKVEHVHYMAVVVYDVVSLTIQEQASMCGKVKR